MSAQIRPKTSSLAVKVERNDHTTLTHRNDPNQHTIEAIAGLAEALTSLNNLISDLQNKTTLNEEGSVEAINALTKNLTELINEETKRSIEAEQALKEKLEVVDQDVIALGNELSARIDTMQVVENVKNNLNHYIFKTLIPRNIRLAEAPSHGLPINLYDPRSTGAESYMLLAEEVIHKGEE